MNALISASEVDSLLKRTTPYSQRELMQLASFSFSTLADKLSDLSYSEKAADITSYLKRGECSSAYYRDSGYRRSDTVQPMLGRSSNKHAF